MFRKHPLRDFMIFLLLGMTATFTFNVKAVDTGQNNNAQAIHIQHNNY